MTRHGRGPRTWGALLFVALAACGGNHERLAPDTGSAGQGTGAVGGAGGAAGSGGAGGSTASGTGGGPVEPPGATAIAVVNGIVDADAIRLCWLPYPAGGGGAVPWPDDPAGLPFGRAERVEPLADLVPVDGDVAMHVVAGELATIAGLDCAAIVAAGSTASVEVRALGVLPASVFASGRSLLFAPAGCLGGAGHSEAFDAQICGAGYASSSGNATLVAASLSRITEPGRVGLQFAQASYGTPVLELRLTAGTDGAGAMAVAPGWSFGAVKPYPPFAKLSRAELGDLDLATLSLVASGQPTPVATAPFSLAFAGSDLSASDLVDGEGFVVVAVGAAPSFAAGSWWHAFAFTLLRP